MISLQKCPICGSELKCKSYLDEYGRTEESYEECINGCYCDEYVYGNTKVLIFGEEFYGDYSFVEEDWDTFHNKIEKAIKYWKENDRYLMRIITG